MGAFCRQTEVALTGRRTTRYGYPCVRRDGVVVGPGQQGVCEFNLRECRKLKPRFPSKVICPHLHRNTETAEG
jgi:hypothetical protein